MTSSYTANIGKWDPTLSDKVRSQNIRAGIQLQHQIASLSLAKRHVSDTFASEAARLNRRLSDMDHSKTITDPKRRASKVNGHSSHTRDMTYRSDMGVRPDTRTTMHLGNKIVVLKGDDAHRQRTTNSDRNRSDNDGAARNAGGKGYKNDVTSLHSISGSEKVDIESCHSSDSDRMSEIDLRLDLHCSSDSSPQDEFEDSPEAELEQLCETTKPSSPEVSEKVVTRREIKVRLPCITDRAQSPTSYSSGVTIRDRPASPVIQKSFVTHRRSKSICVTDNPNRISADTIDFNIDKQKVTRRSSMRNIEAGDAVQKPAVRGSTDRKHRASLAMRKQSTSELDFIRRALSSNREPFNPALSPDTSPTRRQRAATIAGSDVQSMLKARLRSSRRRACLSGSDANDISLGTTYHNAWGEVSDNTGSTTKSTSAITVRKKGHTKKHRAQVRARKEAPIESTNEQSEDRKRSEPLTRSKSVILLDSERADIPKITVDEYQ